MQDSNQKTFANPSILPVEAYTSQKWFDLEQKQIFGRTWQFAGLREDLLEAGDYLTVQCGVQNILVILDQDLQLRAFHNLCRHRGTQLLRAVGKKQKALSCPYHDWTYNLQGKLISVPEKKTEFPDLDINKICLHKASVDTWRGMIWVHPNPEASPLRNWLKPCQNHLGPHNPERLIEYPDTLYDKVVAANWKIIAENYIDVYHLSHLHSNTLNMYNHRQAEFGFVEDHYVFFEPLSERYRKNLDALLPFPRIQEMTDEYLGTYVPWLFPNLGLTESEASWSTFHIHPLAPDKTRIIVRTKIEEMSNWEYFRHSLKTASAWKRIMGQKTKYGQQPDPNSDDPMEWNDFMEEDIYVCEQLQKSLKHPLYSSIALARFGEQPIQQFQKIVSKWMALG